MQINSNSSSRVRFSSVDLERLRTTLKGLPEEVELPQTGNSSSRYESVLVLPAVGEVRRTIRVSNFPRGQEPSSGLQRKASIYDSASRGLKGGTLKGIDLNDMFDKAGDYLAAGLDQFGTPSAKVAFNKLFNRETAEFGFDPGADLSKVKGLYNKIQFEQVDERIRNGENPLTVALSILSKPENRELIVETLGDKEASRVLSIASQCLDPGSLLTLLRGYSQPENFSNTSNLSNEILSSAQKELLNSQSKAGKQPSLLEKVAQKAKADLLKWLS
jgi:hypothetical protein